jgi:predicted DsbA family dithiol-disulfide isomerase
MSGEARTSGAGANGAAVRPLVEVTEYTDPGCVWSWSSEPKLRWLRHRYGGALRWRRVFGIQLDALAERFPGADPVGSAEEFRGVWLEVSGHTGAPVTERLEWMHGSTRPAALAAKAAELQGDAVAEPVLRRLREAVFVVGRPADTPARIAAAVYGVPGLDIDRLIDDAASDAVEIAIGSDWEETRRPRQQVIGLDAPPPAPGGAVPDGDRLRYGFPTLIVRGPAGERVVPGWRDPAVYVEAVEAVAPALIGLGAPPLSAADALARYRSLDRRDLELLTGSAEPPADAIRVDTATEPLWLHPDEIAARGPLRAAGAAR